MQNEKCKVQGERHDRGDWLLDFAAETLIDIKLLKTATKDRIVESN